MSHGEYDAGVNGLKSGITTIMRHVAELVPNPKRALRRPGESESKKQQGLRRQAVTQMMTTSTCPLGDSRTLTPSKEDKIRTKSRHRTNLYWRH